jgi:hypothetical protein
VLAPPALQLLYSLATGAILREVGGSPLWPFLGLLLLKALALDTGPPALRQAGRRLALVVVGFWALAVVKNTVAPLLGRPGRIHFPGKRLADEVTARWQARCGRPLPLVVGDCWLASNVGCYARPRPSTYFAVGLGYLVLDPRVVPWTCDEDVRRRGAVLLWDAARLGDDLPEPLRRRFPDAEVQAPLVLPYEGTARGQVRVGVALQLPAGQPGA